MPRVDSDTFVRLQNDPSCIRNICIVAHVDHGKTSLSDSLLASNGIISQRLAGKIRYLDSRPDEQLRGITMESSAISLYFRVLHKQENSEEPIVNEHLINLIDSPGHIDFSSEVSAASKLCDGAVVLVDVVEGVCSQTVTVLRQCWTEKLKPVLVLNKIDRLITELQLTPQEAYLHLSRVIEQANSIIGSFFAGQRQLDDYSWREELEKDKDAQFVEKDDSGIYFSPVDNNVIFASAVDGWGFNISQMAKFYEQKLGAKRENLQKVLWGDFYLDPKSKKIINQKGLKNRPLKPLFVSLILENIWKIYENVIMSKNVEIIEKITKTLNINVLPRDLRSKDDKQLLRKIMSQWLSVSTAVLLTVIEKLPSPLDSQGERLDTIISGAPGVEKVDHELLESMRRCDRNGNVSAYVSKMLSIPREELPITSADGSHDPLFERAQRARADALRAAKQAELTDKMNAMNIKDDKKNDNEDLYKRAKDTVLTPEIGDSKESDSFKIVTEKAPEFDLGFEYEMEDDEGGGTADFVPEIDPNDPLSAMFEYEEENPVELPAANTVPEALDDIFDEEQEAMIAFARIYSGTLKVGQEISVLGPKYDPQQPDKFIETATITSIYLFMGRELVPLKECPSGNIVGLGGLAGKILKNGTLVQRGVTGINLAGVIFQTTPIVRVAIEPANPMEMNKLARGLKLLNHADPCVETYVEDSGEHILCTAGELHLERCIKDLRERFAGIEVTHSEPAIPYRETFLSVADMNPTKNAEGKRGSTTLMLGPYKISFRAIPLPSAATTFLESHQADVRAVAEDSSDVSAREGLKSSQFAQQLKEILVESRKEVPELTNDIEKIAAFGPKRIGPNLLISENGLLGGIFSAASGQFEFSDSVINGFQLAVTEGPLAKEPVQGMCIVVEDISEVTEEDIAASEDPQYQRDLLDVSGRLITSTRDSIHEGFLDWAPRMMWAMYSCNIQTSVDVLGKVYAVVQQRRGKIVSEEMKEGTPFFQIEAHIPVVEAFGFSEDIRKKTSGAAQPQLVFAGFECIDLDPFWVPTTEEELEELGDTADKENIARRHMNNVRRRKGLFINEKLIENAEKQRTLKKN